jgi:hypothetical protein
VVMGEGGGMGVLIREKEEFMLETSLSVETSLLTEKTQGVFNRSNLLYCFTTNLIYSTALLLVLYRYKNREDQTSFE